jgi:hypothetical protein
LKIDSSSPQHSPRITPEPPAIIRVAETPQTTTRRPYHLPTSHPNSPRKEKEKEKEIEKEKEKLKQVAQGLELRSSHSSFPGHSQDYDPITE